MRNDSENLAILESLKPEHARYVERRIRAQADLERGERDLAELKAALREEAGTDDLEVVRARISENYAENTRRIDEFTAAFEEVKAALAAIDAGEQ